jgi:hypothetical protein
MTDEELETIWLDEVLRFLEGTPGFHETMSLTEAGEAHGMTEYETMALLESRVRARTGRLN